MSKFIDVDYGLFELVFGTVFVLQVCSGQKVSIFILVLRIVQIVGLFKQKTICYKENQKLCLKLLRSRVLEHMTHCLNICTVCLSCFHYHCRFEKLRNEELNIDVHCAFSLQTHHFLMSA